MHHAINVCYKGAVYIEAKCWKELCGWKESIIPYEEVCMQNAVTRSLPGRFRGGRSPGLPDWETKKGTHRKAGKTREFIWQMNALAAQTRSSARSSSPSTNAMPVYSVPRTNWMKNRRWVPSGISSKCRCLSVTFHTCIYCLYVEVLIHWRAADDIVFRTIFIVFSFRNGISCSFRP